MPRSSSPAIPPARAFWMIVAGLVLSWVGWQVMIIGGTYMGEDWTEAAYFAIFGALLVMYAVRLRAGLKRADALPAREPMQLFYVAVVVALPILTYLLRKDILSAKLYNAPRQLIYLSGLISLGYLIVILLALLLDSEHYPRAESGAWSRRFMRWLRRLRHRREE